MTIAFQPPSSTNRFHTPTMFSLTCKTKVSVDNMLCVVCGDCCSKSASAVTMSALRVSTIESDLVKDVGTMTDHASMVALYPPTQPATVDVLGTEEVIYGLLWGIGLALSFSFLQRITSSTIYVPWRFSVSAFEKDEPTTTTNTDVTATTPSVENAEAEVTALDVDSTNNCTLSGIQDAAIANGTRKNVTIFDEDKWREMSRPENYAVYERRRTASGDLLSPTAKKGKPIGSGRAVGSLRAHFLHRVFLCSQPTISVRK